MRVALYHPWIYLRGGIERLVLELIRRSRHDWTLWTHHYQPETTFDGFRDVDVHELWPRISVQRSLSPLMRAASAIARTQLPDDGARALLVSSEGLGDLLLARTRLPAAAYCHTPLKILHDPVTRERFTQGDVRKAATLHTIGPAFSAVDRRMWRHYRHVFVNSHETLARCVSAGLHPAGRFDVVHPGVDGTRFYDDGGQRDRFFLVAGRIMWQKNIELAIETTRLVKARGTRMRLVVAGAVDGKSRPYLEHLRWLARGLDVEFVVDPSDDELATLYRRCLAVLFTPWNEDFGLVPLEAMASGAPVLSVDRGGPRDTVVAGETGWLLPDDPSAFADVVERLLRSPGRLAPMRARARAHAERFTWDSFVIRIDEVMGRLAAAEPVLPVEHVPALSGVACGCGHC